MVSDCDRNSRPVVAEDLRLPRDAERSGTEWGSNRYHELIGSVIPLEAVVYLGEGHTPVVAGNDRLAHWVGSPFSSRTTARIPAPLSRTGGWPVPSATSTTSSAIKGWRTCLRFVPQPGILPPPPPFMLPISRRGGEVGSPAAPWQGNRSEQLGQPLGSGAMVIEIPGVFR